MIDKLEIYDFQAHKHSELTFSPNLTAIVGLNNHGKSAIAKALFKVIRNTPDGNTFIRDGQSNTKIVLHVGDNEITRCVSNKLSVDGNFYDINGDTYVKFSKTGIPKEITSALDISDLLDVDGISIDLNFQHALDPLFLVTGVGLSSLRSKVLNILTGVDIAQKAAHLGGADEKVFKSDIVKLNNDIENCENSLSRDFIGVEDMRGDIELAKKWMSAIVKIKNELAQCQQLLQTIVNIIHEANDIKSMISAISIDFPIDDIISNILQFNTLNTLQQLDNAILNNNTMLQVDIPSVADIELDYSHLVDILQLQYIDSQISNLKKCNLIQIPEATSIDSLILSLDKFQSFNSFFVSITIELEATTSKVSEISNDYKVALGELNEIIKFLDVCPLCGNKLDVGELCA